MSIVDANPHKSVRSICDRSWVPSSPNEQGTRKMRFPHFFLQIFKIDGFSHTLFAKKGPFGCIVTKDDVPRTA